MTCKYEPALVWPDKHPDANEDYAVDFTAYLTRWRQSGTDYTLTTRVRVASRPGHEYEVTTAGQTGGREPIFPTTIGSTVTDGSVVWTCRAVSTSSLKATVSSVAWAANSTDITIASESLSGQIATAFLSGGQDGTDYEVKVTATLSNGASVPKLVILPVRKPRRVCVA